MKCSNVLALLILSCLSSCKDFPPPKGELCVATGFQSSELACDNSALAEDKRKYFRHLEKSDIVTNPDQFERVQAYCIDLRQELIKCNRRKK